MALGLEAVAEPQSPQHKSGIASARKVQARRQLVPFPVVP